MDDEIDPNVIKATQISLGKYVKRPPLSDKLLRKPPFRFLHDIVTSVLKSKGFFNGLFDENELNSDNVKDRESKILFLNKVISVVSLTTGQPLSVKPSKVVAGQEATKTNELLQCIAQALDKNLSSDEAVKQFKSGTKISPSTENKNKKDSVKPVKRNTETKKLTSRSSEKLVSKEKDGQTLNKPKQKESITHKKESPPKKTLSKIVNKKQPEKPKQEVKQNDNIELKNKLQVNKSFTANNVLNEDNERNTSANETTEQNKILLDEDNIPLDIKSSSNENILQSDIKIQDDLSNNTTSKEGNQEEEVNVHASKPNSAEKYLLKDLNPIKIEEEMKEEQNSVDNLITKTDKDETKVDFEENKKKTAHDGKSAGVAEMFKEGMEENPLPSDRKDISNSTIIRPSSVRPSSSRPGAPRLRDKSDNIMSDTENIIVGKVNIISENTLQEEEEDTSIIVENQMTEELHGIVENQESNSLVSNQNSHLVQQILDSQKEFTQISGKTEIEWQFGAHKTQDVFIQEMEQLRFSVQALSRIANPLGKLLDHIQEDVEVMRQELQQWTIIYEETSKDLLKQKTANEESLVPFHTKLKQLTTDIKEKQEKITDLKVSIHKNAARIEKLLANGMVQ
ncbi:uncharacterized protein IFT54 [Epargyreus clarus]|uniref:uncharacterized protein IFT54 n=1 Tax=Epargyreus clarus TaxID=520877 RepID=UPI003C2C0502